MSAKEAERKSNKGELVWFIWPMIWVVGLELMCRCSCAVRVALLQLLVTADKAKNLATAVSAQAKQAECMVRAYVNVKFELVRLKRCAKPRLTLTPSSWCCRYAPRT